MSEYSIVTFLKKLAEDEMEEELIELIAMDLEDDQVLQKVLETIEGERG